MGLLDNIRHYPTSVFYILGNELCERFSFYGMKALLVTYLVIEHAFPEHQATGFYHFFTCIAYLTPLIGSTLADSYFGRFNVIFYVSIVYVLGHVLLSFGAIPLLSQGIRLFFDMGGLLVIALATGGIKPCVSAFAADQFEEHQRDLRAQFFSFFYFAINAGSLMAFLVTPRLRYDVKCFGQDQCFPLAFGVPGVLMLLALILFVMGWKKYKRCPPSHENMAGMVARCIGTAAIRKNARKSEKRVHEHWLDYASPDFTKSEIASVKSFVAVALIFGPLVLFWALFDQMGSTWVLQARRLDGQVGLITILPEQISLLNPLIVLIAVPLFEGVIYPAVRKVVKVTPLRKMAVGGLLTAVSFVVAGLLQFKVNESMELLPAPDHIWVRPIDPQITIHFTDLNNLTQNGDRFELPRGLHQLQIDGKDYTLNGTMKGDAVAIGMIDGVNGPTLQALNYSIEKCNGYSRLYLMLLNSSYDGANFFVINYNDEVSQTVKIVSGLHVDLKPKLISRPEYTLAYGKNCTGLDCPFKTLFYAQMGSTHVILVDGKSEPKVEKLVRGNEVSILWMIPQCIVITIGEVLLSVTGLEFAYSQASPTMKSMLQALWQLTVFAGNLIDMAVSGSHIISDPAWEFFLYAGMMLAVMILFIFLAIRYKYVENADFVSENDEKREQDSLEFTLSNNEPGKSAQR
ncbi:unnamed protein product, partial [Mesorhabditis belari]|uniref:Peptide transporter 2 n=1 Tax=Mesorhabditis belari TaxID=2138241 RepID=A0AAF3F215_9BILA